MNPPFLSIIVPVRDTAAHLLNRCVLSLASQTLHPDNFEVIFVNDCSSHQVAESLAPIMSTLCNGRLVHPPSPHGVSAARNAGALAATGDILIALDSDDWLTPDALAETAHYRLSHPSIRFTYGQHCRVDVEGRIVRSVSAREFDPELLLHMNYISPLKSLDRAIHCAIGGYDETLSWGEDWDYALRATEMLKPEQCALHRANLYRYVIHENNSIHQDQKILDNYRLEIVSRALHRRGIVAVPFISHRTADGYTFVDWSPN